jgi:DNA polymerase-1
MSALSDVQLHLITSLDEALELKRWLGERREILAVDTESSGLSPTRDKLRLVQVGDHKQGWAIPWPMWGGFVKDIFRDYDGPIVMHNLPHDWRFLHLQGDITLPWHRLDDTLLMASLDDPARPRGLKPLSKKLVDPRADSGQRALDDGMKAAGWTWATVPVDFVPYWYYSALDPVLTAHLWSYLKPRVSRDCPLAYDLELGTNRVCTQMMLRGIRLDREYVAEAQDKLEKYSKDARFWLDAAYGINSVLSAKQISSALSSHGEPPTAWTPTGLPKMDKEFLTRIRDFGRTSEAREIAQQVLGVRHAEKMISSYLENFVKRMDDDGMVRCSIWSAEAITGRMSCTDPALQTLSRDDTFIRGSFIPREGNVFISCDYSQVEARLAAHYGRDLDMIQAFLDADAGGPDFFTTIASQIYNRPISKADIERQFTKNVTYCTIYGGGLEKMAKTGGVSPEVMAPVKEGFDTRFPGLRRFMAEITAEAKETGRREGRPAVRSGMGRYLPVEERKEYVASNRVIQAEAAEVLKRAMLDLDAAGLGEYMILPIHDEVLFDVPREESEEACKLIGDVMTVTDRYLVPLTAKAQILEERWAK